MGGHPLYYTRERDGSILACSQLAPLLRTLGRETDVEAALIAELLLHTPGSSRTPYRGIRRLLSGELVFFDDQGERHERFPPLPPESDLEHDVEALAERLLHLIDRAVARAVGTSKKVAVALGGLDSSGLLAALVAHGRGATEAEVKAITLHFADRDDDRRYVRDLCESLGIEPTRVKPADCARFLLNPSAIDACPINYAQAPWMLEISSRAKEQGADVILTGEGGDLLFDGDFGWFVDQFLGGHPYRAMRNAARLRGVPYLGSKAHRISALVFRPAVKRLFPRAYATAKRVRSPSAARTPRWAGPILRAAIEDQCPDPTLHDLAFGGIVLDIRDSFHHAAHYTGCPTEHPYLDEELVRFMHSLPKDVLFWDDFRRGFFRFAFRHRLPESVRLREFKSGFGPASAEIFRAAGGAKRIAPFVPMRNLSDLGIVDAQEFKREFERLERAPDEATQWVKVWPAIATEAFLTDLHENSGTAA